MFTTFYFCLYYLPLIYNTKLQSKQNPILSLIIIEKTQEKIKKDQAKSIDSKSSAFQSEIVNLLNNSLNSVKISNKSTAFLNRQAPITSEKLSTNEKDKGIVSWSDKKIKIEVEPPNSLKNLGNDSRKKLILL